MEKCWLIRTKNKQILGPVTKQKIIEFVNKGSLAPDDEVTSGNGYWILIKEANLVEKYIHGDIPQGFNPISEAPNVLTANINQPAEHTGSLNPNTMPSPAPQELKIEEEEAPIAPAADDLDYPDMTSSSDEVVAPSNEDLEYPDMGIVEENPVVVTAPVTEAGSVKAAPVQASTHVEAQEPGHDEEGKLPEGDDLDYPDMGLVEESKAESFDPDATDPSFDMSTADLATTNVSASDVTQDDIVFSEPPQVMESVTPEIPPIENKEPPKKKAKVVTNKTSKNSKKKKKRVVKPQRNDRYLFYILILLIVIIFSGAYYYFTNIINSDVVRFSNPLMPAAHAQVVYSGDVKKKTFLK